ncbi:hypothetical protein BDR04DRAFT_1121698 [Suillus decipiens]|nr:hypothetical protein BDR04DRAFT_1121698 [Suillus decipiens]
MAIVSPGYIDLGTINSSSYLTLNAFPLDTSDCYFTINVFSLDTSNCLIDPINLLNILKLSSGFSFKYFKLQHQLAAPVIAWQQYIQGYSGFHIYPSHSPAVPQGQPASKQVQNDTCLDVIDEEEEDENNTEEAYARHLEMKICHFPIYQDHCKEQGIKIYDHAISSNYKATDEAQQTLDQLFTPKISEYTKSGLMDYIFKLIVSKDETFQLVDKEPFC